MHSFIISLPECADRLANSTAQLQSLGFDPEPLVATDGRKIDLEDVPLDPRTTYNVQKGELGIWMSTMRIASRIVRRDLPMAAVFEDDVIMSPAADFSDFHEAIASIPKDVHFCHLHRWRRPEPTGAVHLNRWFDTVRTSSYVTVATVMGNAGARAILAGGFPVTVPCDRWIAENEYSGVLMQPREGGGWFDQSFWLPSTTRETSMPGAVPKIIHRIWVGDAPIPDDFAGYWENWKRHHPDFRHITWDDAAIDREFPGHRAIADARRESHAAVSDIARLLILDRFGGMYVDTDFDCCHAFDRLLASGSIIIPDMWDDIPCNGLMAAAPENPLIREMAAACARNLRAGKWIIDSTGPGMVRDVTAGWRHAWGKNLIDGDGRHIATSYGDTGLVVIKPDVLFPVYWFNMRVGERIPKSSYGAAWAVHHWGRSWWTDKELNDQKEAFPNVYRETR